MSIMTGRAKRALCMLINNPIKFMERLRLHIFCFYNTKVLREKRVNGISFQVPFDSDKGTKTYRDMARMYYSSYELKIVHLMKSYLYPGDIFIDVGANIGYLSAIGLGLVKEIGQVHSFEPVPWYFKRLNRIKTFNPEFNFNPNNYALGQNEGTAKIYIPNIQNIGWNTMVPNSMEKEIIKETNDVRVTRLDKYIEDNELCNISLIKIDVEGYEFPVLLGLSEFLKKTSHWPVIICEIIPSCYSLIGYTLTQFSEYMKSNNYIAYSTVNPRLQVDITTFKDLTNVVFLHEH